MDTTSRVLELVLLVATNHQLVATLNGYYFVASILTPPNA